MATRIRTKNWSASTTSATKFTDITEKILRRSLERTDVEDIYLWDQKGVSSKPPQFKGKNFIIHFNSKGHLHDDMQEMPETMWGHPLMKVQHVKERRMFIPAGKGYVIIEPESSQAVAELIHHELYIFFPIHTGRIMSSESGLAVYREILRQTVGFLGGSLPTLGDIVTGNLEPPGLDALRSAVTALNVSRKNVQGHIARVEELRNSLRQVERASDEESDRTFEQISAIPEVQGLDVDGTTLKINTHTMYIDHPRDKTIRELGSFDISLQFGSYAKARFENTTRRPYNDIHGTYGHPHVDRANGYWCEGEGLFIKTLLRQYEFLAATVSALKAIESVNVDSSGNYMDVLNSFPKATSRKPYPKKSKEVKATERAKFRHMYKDMRRNTQANLRQELTDAERGLTSDLARITDGALAERLLQALNHDEHNAVAILQKEAAEQIAAVQHLQYVSSVVVEDTVMRVMTSPMPIVDRETRKEYLTGPFMIEYSFLDGSVRFSTSRPTITKNGAFVAPHLPEPGFLPAGQLSATIAELIGTMELETAVLLTLEFLSEFNGSEVLPEALQVMSAA